MRRRLSVMLVAIPLLLVLTLPAAASAGSSFWVRDRRGHLVGSVRGAVVYDNGGSRAGHLEDSSLADMPAADEPAGADATAATTQ